MTMRAGTKSAARSAFIGLGSLGIGLALSLSGGSALAQSAGSNSTVTYSSYPSAPASSTTVRTISTRTYTRRINSDGSVTEVPGPVSTSSALSAEPVSTRSYSYQPNPVQSSTADGFDRYTSAPVVSTISQPEPRSASYETRQQPTNTGPVRTVTRTYASTTTVEHQPNSAPTTIVARNVTQDALPAAQVMRSTQPVSSSSKPASSTPRSMPPAPTQPQTARTAMESEARVVQRTSASTTRTEAPGDSMPTDVKDTLKLPADTVPNVETLQKILWSTLYVMDEARATGDFDGFLNILSPRMKDEYTPAKLPKAFQEMTDEQQQIRKAVGAPVMFELQPYLLQDGRMRLRGAFPTEVDEALRFDLLYTNVDGVWYVDAMALAKG